VPEWPLIGREVELAEIGGARGELGCAGVVVSGAAGVGKSRLAREACSISEREGALVEWVQATRSAATVPLAAVASLVPASARSEDVVGLMRDTAEALRARAGRSPVVLAVDDAQLLDPVSAALVLHLATTASAFVLATLREGELPPDALVSLWKDAGAKRIELSDLSSDDVRALVAAALGDPVEEAAVQWVLDVGRGNALYVRELVDGAVEQGALVHADGFWRLDRRPATKSTLIELVERRLEGLGASERAVVDLLALGEPLHPEELERLTSEQAVLDAEAHGLLALRGDDVALAHPLYGEAVRRALPRLRACAYARRLADALLAREPFGPDDALRVARLQLDAGAELEPALAETAARAANRAGDPELGAGLATHADGLPAKLLLAQAHAMRNRHADAEAVLAEAEPLAPGHPHAPDYLKQRAWLLHYGLRRPQELDALLDRAHTWPVSALLIERLRQTHGDGDAAAIAAEIAEDERVGDESRRAAAAMHTLSAFLAGRGDEAAAIAWRARPAVPLRDTGDRAALSVLSLVGVETGADWPRLEDYMGETLRAGVRANDHVAAGFGALTVARLRFLRGRYRDATRWLAEAELHLEREDPFGIAFHVHGLRLGVAVFTRDFDAAERAHARLRAGLEGREPLAPQRVHIARAEGWAARLRSDAAAAKQLLAAAERFKDMPGLAAGLAYEARRAGGNAAAAVEAAAGRCETRLVRAYAAHATARDGAALLKAADELAAIGAHVYAMEAAAEAAAAYIGEGRGDSARRAAHRARELHAPGQGAEPPRIDGLDSTAIALTAREAQLTELAAAGLSNAEIADRLVLSVRTVETHLYRAMQKLGVSDRRDL
jgi:DNA-binding CsgD family transcriptional regulator